MDAYLAARHRTRDRRLSDPTSNRLGSFVARRERPATAPRRASDVEMINKRKRLSFAAIGECRSALRRAKERNNALLISLIEAALSQPGIVHGNCADRVLELLRITPSGRDERACA